MCHVFPLTFWDQSPFSGYIGIPMGLSQLADAAAAPALEKGRPYFDVLHFVWQSLFGSPATVTTLVAEPSGSVYPSSTATTTPGTLTTTSPSLRPSYNLVGIFTIFILCCAATSWTMTSTSSTTNVTMDLVKDTYIPIFSNRPEDYREWRTRIVLYKKKLDLQKKSKEACINLMTSRTGTAWRQIEHMVDRAAEDEQGFETILKELDKTFKYDDQVEMPRAFERFFHGTSRRDGQTLLNYVAAHREALTEVEKHGIKLPDNVAGS